MGCLGIFSRGFLGGGVGALSVSGLVYCPVGAF
jgi:hypothetical protein